MSRRLPWLAESGQPAFLVSEDRGSLLNVMADTTEEQLLSNARDVHRFAAEMLGANLELSVTELTYTAKRLTECLADALNVAALRGERLDAPSADVTEPVYGNAAKALGEALRAGTEQK